MVPRGYGNTHLRARPMASEQELQRLQEELRPIVQDAIARGEDLSTPEHMQRFVERVLEQNGYALRGDKWVTSDN